MIETFILHVINLTVILISIILKFRPRKFRPSPPVGLAIGTHVDGAWHINPSKQLFIFFSH